MLKLVERSEATKTRGIAVTYRAGAGNMYGTCPTYCKMNSSGRGSDQIDREYFQAMLSAVPPGGQAFTYTHFKWHLWCRDLIPGGTVVNYSTESLIDAAAASRVVPTVVVVAESDWAGRKTMSAPLLGGRPTKRAALTQSGSVRVVRCPAELDKRLSCADCGGGRPLCARADRDYVIGFTAHGSSKRLAADPDQRGGCYGDTGHCRIHWGATAAAAAPVESEPEQLRRFAAGLPAGSILRHHVAGDIGRE